jgi:hypothetical protein
MSDLRILAGPDLDHLEDMTVLVNSGRAHTITSDAFDGAVAMYIKGFPADDTGPAKAYFDDPTRAGCTWSIQFQGLPDPRAIAAAARSRLL